MNKLILRMYDVITIIIWKPYGIRVEDADSS